MPIMMRAYGALALALILLSTGCSDLDWHQSRAFTDEQSTIKHFRNHKHALQNLAVDWLASGNQHFCTFGTGHMHWNDYQIEKTSLGWAVRYSTHGGWAERSFKSEDQAAHLAKTTGPELESWQRQMLALTVECIDVVPITYRGKSGHYVQLALPPPLPGYGFRFAPVTDSLTSEAFVRWASIPPPHGRQAMHVVGSGWFYYEGLEIYAHAPFSEIDGRVLYSNGQPATKIDVRLDRAFGFGPDGTKTAEDGSFRATWVTSGRYRVVTEVFDASIRSYRTWYYPGVSNPELASEFAVAEDQKLDVGTWTLPMGPPPQD